MINTSLDTTLIPCSSWGWWLSVFQHAGLCSEGSHLDWPGSEGRACLAIRDVHSVHPFSRQGPARKISTDPWFYGDGFCDAFTNKSKVRKEKWSIHGHTKQLYLLQQKCTVQNKRCESYFCFCLQVWQFFFLWLRCREQLVGTVKQTQNKRKCNTVGADRKKITKSTELWSRNKSLCTPVNRINLSMLWAPLYLEFFEIFVSGSDG